MAHVPHGKGWEGHYSKSDDQDENVLTVKQIPDLPLPIKKAAGCSFEIPHHGHVNYVTRPAQGGKAKFVELVFKLEGISKGKTKFKPLDGGDPATFHLYLEEGRLINNWWCHTNMRLDGVQIQAPVLNDLVGKKQMTLRAPLTPESWSNVAGFPGSYSSDTKAAFGKMLANMGDCGITFGGWSQWGHGVKVGENAAGALFTIVSYKFTN